MWRNSGALRVTAILVKRAPLVNRVIRYSLGIEEGSRGRQAERRNQCGVICLVDGGLAVIARATGNCRCGDAGLGCCESGFERHIRIARRDAAVVYVQQLHWRRYAMRAPVALDELSVHI